MSFKTSSRKLFLRKIGYLIFRMLFCPDPWKPSSSVILTLPRGLVCTANSWHLSLELMKSALLLSSAEIGVWHPQEGRCCLLVVIVGEESSPTFKGLEGSVHALALEISQVKSQSLPPDTYMARDRTHEPLDVCMHVHFEVPNVCWFLSSGQVALCTAPVEPNIFPELLPYGEMESYWFDSPI